MSNRYRPPLRAGHTLVELVAASVSSAMLLAGLGSVMLIGNQIAYTPAASAKRLEAAEAVNELADDVRCATLFVTRTAHVLEFVVTDRNGDGTAERIRYEWSGVPGEPLERTFNAGETQIVVDSVQDFQCSVSTESQTTSVSTTTDSAEALLASNAVSPSGPERNINNNSFSAQRINPTVYSGVPASAIAWNATKVQFQGRQSSSSTETLRVQLRSSGDPRDCPTSEVLGEIVIPESSLTSSAGWNTATFTSPVRGLALHRMYNLVWRGTTGQAGDAARLLTDDDASTSVNESSDAGATWTYMPNRRTYYRIYGTYTSPGSSYNVTRNFATTVQVELQAGVASHSRINASIPLVNLPELLSAYWRTDFDGVPSTADITGDGVADWVVADGDAFNVGTLVNGVWLANESLESRPRNNFTKVTTVEVRCRNTSVGGNGAVMQINVDSQSGVRAPLIVRLQRQSDSSQNLTLLGKTSDAATVSLFQRKYLSPGFVRYRLTVLPDNNLVNLAINGENQGTFSYFTYAPTTDDRSLAFSAHTSNAEFDYVELRVAE